MYPPIKGPFVRGAEGDNLMEIFTVMAVASALKNPFGAIDYVLVPEQGIYFRLKEKTG